MRIIQNDNNSDYDTLIRISGKLESEGKRFTILRTNIFKTLNKINPIYINDIFKPKVDSKLTPNDNVSPFFKATVHDAKIRSKYGTIFHQI